jgi:type III restriction enzyme
MDYDRWKDDFLKKWVMKIITIHTDQYLITAVPFITMKMKFERALEKTLSS